MMTMFVCMCVCSWGGPKVPNKYLTWPNGQLSSFAHNGCFSRNLHRWFKWFDKASFEYFEVSEYDADNLSALQERILAALPAWYRRVLLKRIAPGGKSAVLLRYCHANKGGAKNGQDADARSSALIAAQTEREILARFYRLHNEELFALIGRTYNWHRAADTACT
eukprot:m.134013 g.134013  ORF g.134013 m.134013 type:complete len:165 (-) comp17551_c0_seq19:87-581(-)